MLPRAPACFFKPDDIQFITEQRGMDKKLIDNWSRWLRWKMNNNDLPSGCSIEEFLSASIGSLSEKAASIQINR